ncbi:hypothetical protein LXJ15735_35050 [Lacrimispora xylanolytica]|nr:hypothetical protein [Clostridiales bacterium]
MKLEIITIILSSTVITVLITSIFAFIQNRKSNSLQYITLERKEWREQVRSISDEISMSESESISRILDKLKVRINAYGSNYKFDIFNDSHIWRLIDLTKKAAVTSAADFQECKELLINSISLLLKYDWDRSKREVIGETYLIIEKVSMLVFWCAFGAVMFRYLDNNSTYYKEYLFLFIFCFITYFFVMYNKFYNKKKKSFMFDKGYIEFNIILIILIFIGTFYMSYDYNSKKGMSLETSIGIGALHSLVILLPHYFWFNTYGDRLMKEFEDNRVYFTIIGDFLNRMGIIEKAIEDKKNNDNSIK